MGLRQVIPETASESPEVETIAAIGSESVSQERELLPWFRVVLERLQYQHLLQDGIYARLRTLLPFAALFFVWLRATYAKRPFSTVGFANSSITLRHLLLGVVVAAVWWFAARPGKESFRRLRDRLQAEFRSTLLASFLCGFVLFVGCKAHLGDVEAAILGVSLAGGLASGSLILLLAALMASAGIMPYPGRRRKALIVGTGRRASLLRRVAESSESRLEIIGCLDDQYLGADRKRDKYLGRLSVLPEMLKTHPVELVLIGLPIRSQYESIQRVIAMCESIGVECQYMPDVFETSRVTLQQSAVPSSFAVLGDPPRGIRRWVKRGIDLMVAGPLLLVVLPLMIVIAIAIRLTSPGPILFAQQRYGFNRRRFRMLKFRTMVEDAELRQAALESINEAGGPVFKIKADPRITKVGKILRRTSLDELPQLIHVLRGEMSLVGPRPLPLRDVARFDQPWLLRRFSVPPGLTCLWQIGGRSETKFDEWIKLDLQYVDEWSLALDLRILARTLPAVFRGTGAV